MMAISTSLTDGKLEIVEADTADNDFAVVGTGNPGEITVSGRNGTAVNGLAGGSVTISGVTKDLDVRIYGNANNIINVDNVYIAGNLWVVLSGSDRNTLVLGGQGVVSTTGNISITYFGTQSEMRLENYNVFAGGSLGLSGHEYGSSDDVKIVGASTASGDVVVHMAGGDDSVLLDGVTSSQAISVRNYHSRVGYGEKHVAILRLSAVGHIELETNSHTSHSSLYIDTCYAGTYIKVYGNADHFFEPDVLTGIATVTIARSRALQVVIRTGRAYDRITLYGNFVEGHPGTQQVEFGVHQAVYIDSRSGDDDVQLSYNVVLDTVYAALGNGSDSLSAVGNYFGEVGYFNGKVGEYQSGPDGINRLTLVNNSITIPAFLDF